MSIFENKSCPVCKKEFMSDDDIVVCPECGTPHHRECYNLIGHCVNKGLHASNYDYYEDTKPATEKKTESKIEDATENKQAEDASKVEPEVVNIIDDTENTIDGVSVQDIISAIRQNSFYYLKKFNDINNKNKKTSWNWSAFLFGPFYLLFRKMYRLGSAVIMIAISIVFASNALIYKFAPKFMSAVNGLAELTAQRVSPTNEQIMAVMNTSDVNNAVAIVYCMLGVFLIMNIIIALNANNYYKKHIVNIVNRVTDQLNNGGTFTQATIMGDSADMSQDQLKKLYLSRKGGTSMMAPVFALLIISFFI